MTEISCICCFTLVGLWLATTNPNPNYNRKIKSFYEFISDFTKSPI